METARRVLPKDVVGKVRSGEVLLVCAYEDEEKFKSFHLEKALSLRQFHRMEGSLDKGKEIVFYCA